MPLPFEGVIPRGATRALAATRAVGRAAPCVATVVDLVVMVSEHLETVPVREALVAALRLVDETNIGPKTARRYTALWIRFVRYSEAQGVEWVDQITPDLVNRWLGAAKVGGGRPAISTQRMRRTALRHLFAILRSVGITAVDPTVDLGLPPRPGVAFRGFEPAELDLGRATALATLRETRLPSIWAIAEAGATMSEIPAVTPADVDVQLRRVFLNGPLRSASPRVARLSEWGATQLARRIRTLDDVRGSITYEGDGPIETAQVSTSAALRHILDRSGLSLKEGIGPRSLRVTYGREIYERGHNIELVADGLGISSLDQARELIGADWMKAARG